MNSSLKQINDLMSQMDALRNMAAESVADVMTSLKKEHDEEMSLLTHTYQEQRRAAISRYAEKRNTLIRAVDEARIPVSVIKKRHVLNKPLPQVMADIINGSPRRLTTSDVYRCLKTEHGWTGPYVYVASTLGAHAGKLWRRVSRGMYARLRSEAIAAMRTKSSAVPLTKAKGKYDVPMRDMIIEAVRNARNGQPVGREDIRAYIEKKWNRKFTHGSITPRLYDRLIPDGAVVLAGPGLFSPP